MKTFWDQSWDTVDMDQVRAYLDASAAQSDSMIEHLKRQQARRVCDAGCGCGAYSLKLALNGFQVSGFDISSTAAAMAKELLESRGFPGADFRASDIAATAYGDGQFDAAVSRDVIDHMPLKDGIAAVKELYRITKKGGTILLTLDRTDPEYETEPHIVNSDGDYLFSDGKWRGMVFHPYSEDQLPELVQVGTIQRVEAGADELLVVISK